MSLVKTAVKDAQGTRSAGLTADEEQSPKCTVEQQDGSDGPATRRFHTYNMNENVLQPCTTHPLETEEDAISTVQANDPPPLYEAGSSEHHLSRASTSSLPPSYKSGTSSQTSSVTCATANIESTLGPPHDVNPAWRSSRAQARQSGQKLSVPEPTVFVPRQRCSGLLQLGTAAGTALILNVPCGALALLLLIVAEMDRKRGHLSMAHAKRSLAMYTCRMALAIFTAVFIYLLGYYWFDSSLPYFIIWLSYAIFGGHAYVVNDSSLVKQLLKHSVESQITVIRSNASTLAH